jgi:hypothetical protein
MAVDAKKECKKWMQRIGKAERKRQQFESEWKRNIKAVFGDAYKEGLSTERVLADDEERYDFDLILSYLQTELPRFALYRPQCNLDAKPLADITKEQADRKASRLAAYINSIIDGIRGLETDVTCCMVDAHVAYAIAKTVTTPQFEPNPRAGMPILSGEVDASGQPIHLIDTDTGIPVVEDDETLTSLDFNVYRVDYLKFLVDADCENNVNRAAWVGEETEKNLQEMYDSKLYKREVLKEIEQKERKGDDDKQKWEIRVKFYELYDLINDKIIVIAKNYSHDFLRHETTPQGISKTMWRGTGHPYSILKLGMEIPGQFYGAAPVSSGRIQQYEYKNLRQWMSDWSKQTRPLLGMDETKVPDEEEQKKVVDGISTIIKMQQGGLFWANPDPGNPAGLKEHMLATMQDFDHAMGQSSQDRGVVGKSKFATEAEIAETKGQMRGGDKAQKIALWFSDIVEHIIRQAKSNFPETYTHYIKEGQGKEQEYSEFTFADLDIDVDITIDIEAKTPKNKAVEIKQMTDFLVAMGQTLPVLQQIPSLLESMIDKFDLPNKTAILAELQRAMQPQNMQGAPGGGPATEESVAAGTEGVQGGMMPGGGGMY